MPSSLKLFSNNLKNDNTKVNKIFINIDLYHYFKFRVCLVERASLRRCYGWNEKLFLELDSSFIERYTYYINIVTTRLI